LKELKGFNMMEKNYRKAVTVECILPGTVVGVKRPLYEHYGVLVQGGEVIHYTTEKSDILNGNSIQKTTFKHFLREQSSFWTMQFPSREKAYSLLGRRFDILSELLAKGKGCNFAAVLAVAGKDIAVEAILKNYRLHSLEETEQRAVSRLGEKKYNLAIRNCEHFVFWCATGIATSQQVEGFLFGGVNLFVLLGGSILKHPELSLLMKGNSSDEQALFTKSKPIFLGNAAPQYDNEPLEIPLSNRKATLTPVNTVLQNLTAEAFQVR
jgi:hypothetical protein